MNPNIFREFSIRGIADSDLTETVVSSIGQALSHFFQTHKVRSIVIGHDVRISSPRISQTILRSLSQGGLTVIDVGLVPTPLHNFATDLYKAGGGIMITASHNPAEYNGFKIRLDHPVQGAELQEIYRLASDLYHGLTKPPQDLGSLTQSNPLSVYLQQLKVQADFEPLLARYPFKVVVDGGNGTNGPIVSKLLTELGVEVIELFCDPDGSFPNREPDPTGPTALTRLTELVRTEQANAGLAYDGDGDRLAVVDELGQPIAGDQLIMLLARDILSRGPAKIVYEILCTQALADDILAHGGEPIVTPSGYAFVHEAMQRTQAAIGGEFSGHLFFKEPGFRFDDAILATIKLLNILIKYPGPVSELVAGLPAYHSSPQVRLPCPDPVKGQVIERVKAYYAKTYKVDTVDGARIHFPDGWAMVRQSNTQPVISMRFEARTSQQLQAIQADVQTLVETEIKRIIQ